MCFSPCDNKDYLTQPNLRIKVLRVNHRGPETTKLQLLISSTTMIPSPHDVHDLILPVCGSTSASPASVEKRPTVSPWFSGEGGGLWVSWVSSAVWGGGGWRRTEEYQHPPVHRDESTQSCSPGGTTGSQVTPCQQQ